MRRFWTRSRTFLDSREWPQYITGPHLRGHTLDMKDIINRIPDEEERYLVMRTRSTSTTASSENEQARTLIYMRMSEKLIDALNKNSASSDKLARLDFEKSIPTN